MVRFSSACAPGRYEALPDLDMQIDDDRIRPRQGTSYWPIMWGLPSDTLCALQATQHDSLFERKLRRLQESHSPEEPLAHARTPRPTGWRITEIWESQEQCAQFLESTIMPMAQQVGVPPFQPEFLEAEEAFTR